MSEPKHVGLRPEHIALLTLISQGNYLPHIHADYGLLRRLYRSDLISYGWYQVEVTAAGKALLAAVKKEAGHGSE